MIGDQKDTKRDLDKAENKSYSSLMVPYPQSIFTTHGGVMIAEVNTKCPETISVNASAYSLNHVCCVCQASLDGKPFDPTLKTSHGYCDTCLEAELLKIGV